MKPTQNKQRETQPTLNVTKTERKGWGNTLGYARLTRLGHHANSIVTLLLLSQCVWLLLLAIVFARQFMTTQQHGNVYGQMPNGRLVLIYDVQHTRRTV